MTLLGHHRSAGQKTMPPSSTTSDKSLNIDHFGKPTSKMKSDILSYVGVIYGYDNKCRQSQIWKDTMVLLVPVCAKQHQQVSALPRGEAQPFYHVLADDGSARYGRFPPSPLLNDLSSG